MATTEDKRALGGDDQWKRELYEAAPEREGELFSTISGLENEPLYTPERVELDYDRAPDFPVVAASDAGSSYERCFMLGISATGAPGRKFFDELAAVDWGARAVETWRAPSGVYFASEPVHVPSAGGAGHLVCLAFDARSATTSSWIFDAARVADGPVARLALPHAVPALFHGVWEPASR